MAQESLEIELIVMRLFGLLTDDVHCHKNVTVTPNVEFVLNTVAKGRETMKAINYTIHTINYSCVR